MILEILKIFRKKYNSRDYGITERDYPVLCVYIGEKRHKVVDLYRVSDGTYFAVYKKTPVKERKLNGFVNSEETGYFHGEVNRMTR